MRRVSVACPAVIVNRLNLKSSLFFRFLDPEFERRINVVPPRTAR